MLGLALLLVPHLSDVSDMDSLARGRDANGLAAYASDALKAEHPFEFLGRNGAFGTGQFGWHAYALADPVGGGRYVVFGTRLTSEDYGEYVFEYKGGRLVRLEREDETGGYKVLHYDLDLRFQPSMRTASILATVRLRRSTGARPVVHFRLSPNYQVSSVTDGRGAALGFAQASGVVSVTSPSEVEPVVKLSYKGTVDQPRFAGAITDDEVMLSNDYWWPMVARGPASVTTTTHVPADWTVVANGDKTSEKTEGSEKTVTYDCEVPISYLSLSAGKFQHASRDVDGVTYNVWSRAMKPQDMQAQLQLMPPVVQFYSRFAKFPFKSFGAVVTDLYGGGALEAYSYATYGTGWLPDEDAHEPSHTWWGGLIANTYLHSFWNESFAVYSSGLYSREVAIGNRDERRRAFVSTFDVDRTYDQHACQGAGASLGRAASALGYGKGAAVLEQLEYEIGTDKMVAAMRQWIADNPKGDAGEWDGFEKAVEKTVGHGMHWFFDEWIDKPGAPDFEVSELGYDGGQMHGLVDFNGAPYRLTTEVYAELADGRKVHTQVVLNPDRKPAVSEFSFKLPSKPALVSFDPYDRIVRRRGSGRVDSLKTNLKQMRVYVDPQHKEYGGTFHNFEGAGSLDQLPQGLANVFLIGHPDSVPGMRALCEKAGFKVEGDKLTYDGTTIDLRSGAALAIVDLGDGKVCGIGLGKTLISPDVGKSYLCLVDQYGRFLRGKTNPRRDGTTVFRVP